MNTAHKEKRGVALVITMGFLAVIAILAVSFAVTMRIERLVARSYADGVRARELAHTALARAVDAIHASADAGDWVYMPSNVLWSADGSSNANMILTGFVTNYLPTGLLAEARMQTNKVRWTELQSGTNLIGRIAFMVVNCSGLIDVNLSYDYDNQTALERSYGTNVNELAFLKEILPEVKTPTNIVRARRTVIGASPAFGRIETHAELTPVLAYGYGSAQPFQQPPTYPAHFITFSYFPKGFWDDGAVEPPIYIGGPVEDEEGEKGIGWSDVENAFKEMGLTSARAKVLADNLRDYLDEDFEPRDLDSICTEPVPMINEVIIMNAVAPPGGEESKWHNKVSFGIETWYPFGYPTAKRGDFRVRITGVELDGGGFGGGMQDSPELQLDGGAGLLSVTNGFSKSTHTFDWTSEGDGAGGPPAMPTRLRIGEIAVYRSGTKVDRVGPIVLEWNDNFHATASGATADWIGSSWETDDPRINWNWGAHWQQRETQKEMPKGTFEKMNGIVSYASPGKDGNEVMYVRNKDNLEVVGELGFLLYDETKPWQTIPLLGADALPVLDRFTVWKEDETFRSGLVNVNTDLERVLATVFYNMPVERYPGETAPTTTLSDTQALALAQAVISARPTGGYKNLSDIKAVSVPGSLGLTDELQRKSLIRNSAGLLSVRQNLFMVIVLAQSVVDANDDDDVQAEEIVGEARAVALLWRDPYPEEGMHETFVRYFRWLDE